MSQAPRVTTVTITPERIGYQPGANEAVVNFTFDQPVAAWVLRVNSNSHLDGAEVASWDGGDEAILGFGTIPFGSAPFGGRIYGAAETATDGAAAITWEKLLHGANRVTVYGQAPDGRWSLPVRDMAGAA